MANVTLKDSKNTIWEAYQAALKTINELKATKMDPMAEKELKRVEGVLKEAERIAADDILNPSVIADFNTLKEAIEIKKAELKELTGIEDAVLNLVALINAHADIERNFKADMAARKEAAEQELSDIRAMVAQARMDRAHEDAEYRTNLSRERKREKDEYDYNLKRDRKIENDKWEDEKAERIKIVTAREEAATIREAAVLEKETILNEWKERVEEIPGLVEDAKNNGYKAGKADAEKSFVFEKRAIESNHKSEVSVLENKITYLEDANNRLTAELEKAREEVAAARAEVKAIATEALNASGNAKMITQMQDFAKELSNKNSK